MEIKQLVDKQRTYFLSGATLSVERRIEALLKLRKALVTYEDEIQKALDSDLCKKPFEGYMAEVGMTLSELNDTLRHLRRWAKPKIVSTPLAQFPSRSVIYREPYGVTLVMSPWNYPILLTLDPLIGAIAAGNCCILKPSAYAPAVSKVLAKIISEIYSEEFVAVVEGGRAENTMLLEQKFDYIFFTGGVKVGKLVMEKAAAHLTPVTLELGGKSPCIVDETANIKLAAKRIVFGKLLNSGQTCVAPDYVLVQHHVKDQLIKEMKKQIHMMYGENVIQNPQYPKIINRKHYDRIMGLIKEENVVEGGYGDEELGKISPTILDHITPEDAVMQEEIFGPIFPILTFEKIEEVIQFIQQREKPLALYYFTKDKSREKKILKLVSFGGGCINDTIIHLATSQMGFGGVGGSGMGNYHGERSYLTFSHEKGIVKKANWLDLPMRYQPAANWKDYLVRKFER